MSEKLPAMHRAASHLALKSQRPVAVQIRELMPWIREQLNRGYTHAQVASALEADGLMVSVATLRKELYRKPKKENAADQHVRMTDIEGKMATVLSSPMDKDLGSESEGQTSPPPATIPRLTMAEAMDPKKRAAFAEQFFRTEPLVLKPKRKT